MSADEGEEADEVARTRKLGLFAVVPAAGRSHRMGREKVLLPFGRSTVPETILGRIAAAGVEDVVVVLRTDLPKARELAERAGARVVVNPDPDGEMLVSIRLGVRALPTEAGAFFVWPADHPAVSPATVAALAAAMQFHDDTDTVWIPTWRGRRGHPVLLGSSLRQALLDRTLLPEGGLRELWRARAESVRELAVDDPGVLANLDTPEDYEAARKAWEETGD